jgi:hypothetical protein
LNQLRHDKVALIRERLRFASTEALDCLVELMVNAKSEETRRKCANDILGMAGLTGASNEGITAGCGSTEPREIIHDRLESAQWQRLQMTHSRGS